MSDKWDTKGAWSKSGAASSTVTNEDTQWSATHGWSSASWLSTMDDDGWWGKKPADPAHVMEWYLKATTAGGGGGDGALLPGASSSSGVGLFEEEPPIKQYGNTNTKYSDRPLPGDSDDSRGKGYDSGSAAEACDSEMDGEWVVDTSIRTPTDPDAMDYNVVPTKTSAFNKRKTK